MKTTMSTSSRSTPRTALPRAVPSAAQVLGARLSRIYGLARDSDQVFGSPLGPIATVGGPLFVPRFVYFGPRSTDDSLRLAFYAGFGRHDLTVARALLGYVERLTREPHLGPALNLSFFPVVNVRGLLGGEEERDLEGEDWVRPRSPEVALLAADARARSYRGFIRLVGTTDDEPSARVRTMRSSRAQPSGVEIFTSERFRPWQVAFEELPAGGAASGPLTLAAAWPCAPFEVELALPSDLAPLEAEILVGDLLRRLVTHYRAFDAYGQHL